MTLTPDFGRLRQAAIFVAGLGGQRPAVPTDPDALHDAARRVLSREAFAYLAGGAGGESTVRANRVAFERWRIVPRVLRDVESRDLSTELLGRRLPAPLLLGPIGVLELAHPHADLAVARAAAASGTPFVFSSQASIAMEACARAMGQAPRWFQLYWSRSDALTRSLVARAEACGCEAIVLTLDTTLLGWRTRDLDLGYLPFLRGMGLAQYTSDPVFRAELREPLPRASGEPPTAPMNASTIAAALGLVRRYPGRLRDKLRTGDPRLAVRRFIATYSRPSLAWDDLARLRAMTRLPIVLKGVLHPGDARHAADAGMDAIVVSNHGGRQVDHAIAALDALPGVVDAIAGRLPVLFDSGIRTGAEAFIALALGARAVLLGRPYAYALAVAGERGVREVIDNVIAELDLTMGLSGCASLQDVTRACLSSAS